MELKRRLSLVVAIMSVALGSGHLVQNVLIKPATLAKADLQPIDIMLVAAGTEAPEPQPQPAVQKMVYPSFAASPTEDGPNLFTLPDEPILKAEFDATAPGTETVARQCPVSLDLLVEPSAMIGLTLSAPCHANERVVLLHAGLSVTGKTSGTGTLVASLPAFSSDADVSVRFADGQSVQSKLAVPEAATLRRFGVQWQGDDAFQLNAFENGAGYGEIGHVSAADPQRPLAGQAQIGGFLSVLGDDGVAQPMLAEVYTYPAVSDAPVRIVIEAAITKGTCAREILGETLADVGGDVTITDLSVAMPDCGAIGDILVLKNLDPDLKIASAN
jgi:hypothetical protein